MNLQRKRETVLETTATTQADSPVEFDVVENSEICLAAIKSSEDVKEQAKTPHSNRPRRRSILSSITTRSQTRKCAGRTPGFYVKRK